VLAVAEVAGVAAAGDWLVGPGDDDGDAATAGEGDALALGDTEGLGEGLDCTRDSTGALTLGRFRPRATGTTTMPSAVVMMKRTAPHSRRRNSGFKACGAG